MNHNIPKRAPPVPPASARSPPGGGNRTRRNSAADVDVMDDSLMMRNIWLRLGILDNINYKMDTTLRKLGMLENRMDRLETMVKEAVGSGGASAAVLTGHETNNNLPDMVQVMPKSPSKLHSPPPHMSTSPTSSASYLPKSHPQVLPTSPKPVTSDRKPIGPKPPIKLPVATAAAKNTQPPAPTIIDHVLPACCYVDSTNKEECEKKLRLHQHNGMYLIRKSEKGPKGRVLMVWFHENSICKHYKIFGNQTTCFQLDETPSFTSMVELINYYSHHILPQSTVLLSRPFPG